MVSAFGSRCSSTGCAVTPLWLNFIVTVDELLRALTRSDKSLGRLQRGKGNAAAEYPGLLRLNQVY